MQRAVAFRLWGGLLMGMLLAWLTVRGIGSYQGAQRAVASDGGSDEATNRTETVWSPSKEEVLSTAERLQGLWREQVGSKGGWFYLSYREEYPGYHGTDPVTGVILPSLMFNETWFLYEEDDLNSAILSITRRTDLERDYIDYAGWMRDGGGRIYREPAKEWLEGIEGTPDHPAANEACWGRFFPDLPVGAGATKEITAFWSTDAAGSSHWILRATKSYPPIGNFSDDPNTYVGSEFTCVWNGETGALESIEEIWITDEGKRVLLDRQDEIQLVRVHAPPDEMLGFLKRLRQP